MSFYRGSSVCFPDIALDEIEEGLLRTLLAQKLREIGIGDFSDYTIVVEARDELQLWWSRYGADEFYEALEILTAMVISDDEITLVDNEVDHYFVKQSLANAYVIKHRWCLQTAMDEIRILARRKMRRREREETENMKAQERHRPYCEIISRRHLPSSVAAVASSSSCETAPVKPHRSRYQFTEGEADNHTRESAAAKAPAILVLDNPGNALANNSGPTRPNCPYRSSSTSAMVAALAPWRSAETEIGDDDVDDGRLPKLTKSQRRLVQQGVLRVLPSRPPKAKPKVNAVPAAAPSVSGAIGVPSETSTVIVAVAATHEDPITVPILSPTTTSAAVPDTGSLPARAAPPAKQAPPVRIRTESAPESLWRIVRVEK
jgi:hypothetical protein